MITAVGLQYAKALFDLAKNEKALYYQNLQVIKQSFIDDQEVYKVFSHPKIDHQIKKQLINDTLQDKIDEQFKYYLYVLIDNNRLLDLNNIVEAYKYLLDDYNNQLTVFVYTRFPLEGNEKAKIVGLLEKKYQKTIEVVEYIDRSLVGGLKMVIDGEIIDASTIGMLDNIKTNIKKGW